MTEVRSILERGVGGATPPPDGYERMLRRRDRKQRNKRIRAAVLALTIASAGLIVVNEVRTGTVPGDETPVETPTPRTSPSPGDDPGFFPGAPTRNRAIVVMTEAGCTLDGGTRMRGYFEFVAWNATDDGVAFDIGMLAEGHTFDELVMEVDHAMQSDHVGGPVAQRPRYFHGSITGDRTFGHGGAPGPSLLRIGEIGAGRLTWSHHPGAFRYRGRRFDPQGTWAVICYREFAEQGLEPIGVVGPVEVGPSSA